MPKSKTTLTLIGLLFISLALNFFLAGLILGGRTQAETFRAARSLDQRSNAYEADRSLRERLSEEDRQILRAEMQAHKDQFKGLWQEMRAARDAVEQATTAEPFDQQTLDQALARQQDLYRKKETLMTEMRKNALQNLSPDGRKIFLEMTSRRFGEGGRRSSGDHDRWKGRARPDRDRSD